MDKQYNFLVYASNDSDSNQLKTDSFYDAQLYIIRSYFSGLNCNIQNLITGRNSVIKH